MRAGDLVCCSRSTKRWITDEDTRTLSLPEHWHSLTSKQSVGTNQVRARAESWERERGAKAVSLCSIDRAVWLTAGKGSGKKDIGLAAEREKKSEWETDRHIQREDGGVSNNPQQPGHCSVRTGEYNTHQSVVVPYSSLRLSERHMSPQNTHTEHSHPQKYNKRKCRTERSSPHMWIWLPLLPYDMVDKNIVKWLAEWRSHPMRPQDRSRGLPICVFQGRCQHRLQIK